MPSALAERLGIDLKVVPIEEAHVAFAYMLAPVLGREPAGLTDENLQSRLRGVLLMAVSNAKGWIVLDHGQQERDGHRLLDALRRLGRWVRRDQGRAQDARLRPVPLPQHPGGARGPPGPIPDSVLDKPPVGRAAARPARRPVASALRGARPGAPGLRRARPHGGRPGGRGLRPAPWSTGSCGWSTAPSTSGARCRRGCGSPPRPSARTAACPSPTATALGARGAGGG